MIYRAVFQIDVTINSSEGCLGQCFTLNCESDCLGQCFTLTVPGTCDLEGIVFC